MLPIENYFFSYQNVKSRTALLPNTSEQWNKLRGWTGRTIVWHLFRSKDGLVQNDLLQQ